ncbi:glutathione S-transferase [Basfia succiniciproducens]|uniref:Glutathione S-transferase n=1 Tax=Basfia succiniciproducens TaxID=653940 RepID=A0A1G5AXB0_9PAST|nr:glutathione S-transferase [Basfia succiniciproducens]QIM69653.1 glutathione S-transferase [Basfia succiniciproducens]SCX82549.1 Glutathione S-transferase [Basfia succiniciproducens]SEQ10516.1 Glutathione S-transferase [Basfia succiniciproducens]
MKLWYSTTSPFARKVLVTLKHQQLEDKTDLLRITSSFDPDSPHNQVNPLGRIPALQRNCGNWLFGSLLICEYLDQKGACPKLIPESGKPRWAVLALHNLVDGIMENTMPMVAEKMLRPENEWWTSRHQQLMDRNVRSFTQLEQALVPFGTELNIGTITAVCLIDWWIFRADKIGYDLAAHFPHLVTWAEDMNNKYAILAATKPGI